MPQNIKSMEMSKKEVKLAYEAVEEKKGSGIIVLDISRISSFSDYFVICHGFNRKQNQAIADAVKEDLKREVQLAPAHVEGYQEAEWILLDYLSFVVHIFSPEAREFYRLERLWNDGEEVEVEALIA